MTPPKGFVTVKEVAARLHLEPCSIRLRLKQGWAVSWMRVDRCLYIEDRQSYPPTPGGSPLMRALYAELEYPKALRALAHGRSYASVKGALYLLRERGLVEQVSYGVWGRL